MKKRRKIFLNTKLIDILYTKNLFFIILFMNYEKLIKIHQSNIYEMSHKKVKKGIIYK